LGCGALEVVVQPPQLAARPRQPEGQRIDQPGADWNQEGREAHRASTTAGQSLQIMFAAAAVTRSSTYSARGIASRTARDRRWMTAGWYQMVSRAKGRATASTEASVGAVR